METGKRHIRSGRVFDHLFSKPKGRNVTVKKLATLTDTIDWMKKVVTSTTDHTKKIAKKLQAASVKKTCSNIWNFCFHHFQYEKDAERKEQIRTPNRSWHDRASGIDCDCLTVFISSVLRNLKIPHFWRMTRYNAPNMEHIYPVALTPEGNEVIIDCVVHKFNYEVEYAEKQDVEMDLQILNGALQERYNEFGDRVIFENDLPIDAEDLFGEDFELDGLRDWLKKNKEKRTERKTARKERRAEIKQLPKRERIRARLNQVNKINPAAALMRAGVLASMRLNLFKVASHLRFAYWTPEQARSKNFNMAKYNALRKIRERVEKIYFGAGGKPEALKKAILTGKGNRNRMVGLSGLGSIDAQISDYDDLRTIIGEDLYFDEAAELEAVDLRGLGGIASGAAIAAASGVIATISKVIKKLGGLFNRGSKEDQQMQIQNQTDDNEEKTRLFSKGKIRSFIQNKLRKGTPGNGTPVPPLMRAETSSVEAFDDPIDDFDDLETAGRMVVDDSDTTVEDKKADTDEKGFVAWAKNNKILVGLLGAGALTGLYFLLRGRNKKEASLGATPELSGSKRRTYSKSKTKRSGTKTKSKKRKTARSSIQRMKLA